MMSPDSTFNEDDFMDAEVEAPMETSYTPIPENTYQATIDEVHVREITSKKTQEVSKLLDVDFIVHDPELAEQMGMDQLRVRQGIFLEYSDEGYLLIGPNKNVKLGKLRQAVGQNAPGAWSFRMLNGAGPLLITVTIKPDEDDPEVKYNRVTKTLPLAA